MTHPAKLARIYQYAEADHFDEAAELDGALELFEEAHKRVRAQMQYPLTRNGTAMVEFISGMFMHNVVYSLPQPLMTKLLRHQVTKTFAPDDASVLLALQPGEAANLDLAQLCFFNFIGTQANGQQIMMPQHVAKDKFSITIQLLRLIDILEGNLPVLETNIEKDHKVDLRLLSEPPAFTEFMAQLLVWQSEFGGSDFDISSQRAPSNLSRFR